MVYVSTPTSSAYVCVPTMLRVLCMQHNQQYLLAHSLRTCSVINHHTVTLRMFSTIQAYNLGLPF